MNQSFKCHGCESTEIISSGGSWVCTECGFVLSDFDITDDYENNKTFEEERNANNKNYVYSSISRYFPASHMREILAQKKGKGGKPPEGLIGLIKKECRINHLPYQKLNEKRTRLFMKKLGYTAYYKHAIKITCKINKTYPEGATAHQEEVIRQKHNEALVAWKNAPVEIKMIGRKEGQTPRSSFPMYQDFCKRVCIYSGFYDLEKKFKSLKTPHKIIEMNAIWTYLGTYCNWIGYEIAILSSK